jgi:hypothetical protein
VFLLTIDSNVAQCGGAVVLDIGVGRVEQADQDRDGASVDQLLAVLVCIMSERDRLGATHQSGSC